MPVNRGLLKVGAGWELLDVMHRMTNAGWRISSVGTIQLVFAREKYRGERLYTSEVRLWCGLGEHRPDHRQWEVLGTSCEVVPW